MDGPWPPQEKGNRSNLPRRPEGRRARMGSVPFFLPKGSPAIRPRGRPCWPTRFAMATNCAGCWTCRRGRRQAAAGSPCSSRGPTSRESAERTPGTPCCCKSCLVWRRVLPPPDSRPTRWASRRRQGPCLLAGTPADPYIVATGRCTVHCRFCFRRDFPYPTPDAEPEAPDQAVDQAVAQLPPIRRSAR